MTIYEFVEIVEIELEIKHIPGSTNNFIANLNCPFGIVFCKNSTDDPTQRICSGFGKTPDEAIKDLCKKLKTLHKFVIVEGIKGKSTRLKQSYKIPSNLFYES